MSQDSRSFLVLIVDDDKIVRQILSTSMSRAGYFVAEAENGQDALEQFKMLKPDVVLLDVNMPEVDGFTVCKTIRSLPEGIRVPIIMITGQDDYSSINKAFDCGATDFVVKPVNHLLLSYRVRYILRANKAIDELNISELKLASAKEVAQLTNWEWMIHEDSIVWGKEMRAIFRISTDKDHPVDYQSFLDLVDKIDREQVAKSIKKAISSAQNFKIEHQVKTADNSVVVVCQDGKIIKNSEGEPYKVLFTCQDISKSKITEQKIKFLAYYDRLTGLPNRFLFKEHLSKAIDSCSRRNTSLAILFVDIDNFRNINDTFGRDTGDKLLKILADRLKDCLRPTDTPSSISDFDITARFGADEFGIIIEDLHDNADAAIVARRVINSVTQVVNCDDNDVFLNCRVGVAVYPNDGLSVVELMKSADHAISCAKELEKNTYQFYTADLNSKAFARFALETSLRKAIERDEFILLYQPQVMLVDGNVKSVEALIRWQHPDMGLVAPMDFIPLAEHTGLIIPIGEWVINKACQQVNKWREEGYHIRVAVNLSAAQFKDPNLVSIVKRVIAQNNIPTELLEFETTESMLMDNIEQSIEKLDQLNKLGCRIAIDDFGTGYSSLNYLKKFPVDTLKIDRSFIKDLISSVDDALIVKAIVTLAHNLNLEVVAEGVELKEHLIYLNNLGCDAIQGYLVSKPAPSENVVNFFNNWNIADL